MGRSRSSAGGADHFLRLRLDKKQRGDLLFFAVPFALYAVNECIKYRVSMPIAGYLLRCHFNDYLGGVSFAAYVNLVLSASRFRHKRLRRPLHFILLGIACSLCWEVAAPLFLPYSTGDLWDGAAYLAGMLTYYFFSERKDFPK